MISTDILLGSLVLAILLLFILLFYHISSQRIYSLKFSQVQKANEQLNGILIEQKSKISDLNSEKENLLTSLISLETEYKNLKERFEEKLQDKETMHQQFELLTNRIVDAKAKQFDEAHKEGIKNLLDPLKEKIISFEERVERTNIDAVKRNSALFEQIKSLSELNERITQEAGNLTKALKGDKKMQGNWGELILESVLEKSGLEKGREYNVQETHKNDQGKMIRPDVIIRLPDGKRMIVDSKVSLVAYENWINAKDDGDQEISLKIHTRALHQHILSLSAKNYQDIYSIESPDFVLMFVPIDTAFSAALKHDPAMYTFAFEKNIVIVTPSTLLATLKTVDTMWQNDKQQRFALEIATEAGKMYDKFTSFIQDMEGLGNRLDQAKTSYTDAMRKLSEGRGDLVTRAEKIRQLGAKAKKRLKSKWLNSESITDQ